MGQKEGKDLVSILNSYEKKEEGFNGTFHDFLQKYVIDAAPETRRRINRLAHAYINDMIELHGYESDENGNLILDEKGRKQWKFFTDNLYGIRDSLSKVKEYFEGAAIGSEVQRRLLLTWGPTSTGKSELAILLKKGLEKYSRTEGGARFAIVDCPMHETPLHLIPETERQAFKKEFGITVEGALCPRCELNLKEKYNNNILSVPVRQIYFSEQNRKGIGTFVPSDHKSQDITELVGSMDLALIGEYGAESDPRAYKFDGELNVANQGMMEFIEMLKADKKFLWVLITLTNEKNIKTGRFPLIYADEFIYAHTNETEYRDFMAKKNEEALHDRMIIVDFPYCLTVSDEERILKKIINKIPKENLEHVHFAPHTFRVAAILDVLSRLEQPKKHGLTLRGKMHLYDGEEIENFTKKDIKEIKEDTEREGLDGISPRFTINRIVAAITSGTERKNGIKDGQYLKCINPIDALRAIKDGFTSNPKFTRQDKDNFETLMDEASEEYNEIAREEVQKAFFISFEEEARNLVNNYIDNVYAYLDKKMLKDPITNEDVPPDERLMRSIEDKIRVSETGKDEFRNKIARKVGEARVKGKVFDYANDAKLKEAIYEQLFYERRDTIKITVSSRNPDPAQLQKKNEVVKTLMEKQGYCADCANELLKYVSSLLARG